MPTPELRARLIAGGKARGLDTTFLEPGPAQAPPPGAVQGPAATPGGVSEFYTLPSQDLSTDPDVQNLIKTLPAELQPRAQSTVKAYGGSKRSAMIELNRMGDEAEQAARTTTREQQQQAERERFETAMQSRRESFDRWRESQTLDFKKGQALDKIADPYLDAVSRYNLMTEAVKNPNAQNDVSLLFNHIGMTLGAVKGARVTHDAIQEAITARGVPQGVLASLQSIGLAPDFVFSMLGQDPKNLPPGGFLSPGQRQQMLKLGADVLNAQKAKATERAKIIGIDFDSFVSAPTVETPRTAGAPPAGGPGPAAGAAGAGQVYDLADFKRRFPQRDWRDAVRWAKKRGLSLVNASKAEQDFYNAQK